VPATSSGPPREPNLTVWGYGCRSSQGQRRKMGVSGSQLKDCRRSSIFSYKISHVSQCADRTTVSLTCQARETPLENVSRVRTDCLLESKIAAVRQHYCLLVLLCPPGVLGCSCSQSLHEQESTPCEHVITWAGEDPVAGDVITRTLGEAGLVGLELARPVHS